MGWLGCEAYRITTKPFFETEACVGAAAFLAAVPFEISVGGSEGHGDRSLEALRSTVKNRFVG